MDKKAVMERMQQEALKTAGERLVYAIMTGLNAASDKALMNRPLSIRHFPFRIGRLSGFYELFSKGPDLALEDEEPYRLSREHLTIERRDRKIYLVDDKSRSGSLVNGVPLGGRRGGTRELPLREGDNEVVLGGEKSPFVFSMKVEEDSRGTVLHGQVPYGAMSASLAALYGRFCQQVQTILRAEHPGDVENVKKALVLVRSLTSRPEVINPLYYFSASPETFYDVVTAHSVNVTVYAVKLAMSMSYDIDKIVKAGTAALLHDIGLLDLPPEIINTTRELSGIDEQIMKEHTTIGYEKLKGSGEEFPVFPAAALEHHERVDGRGYPRGIADPNEAAELVGIVDFFESVTHYRPQRGPVTPHEGIRMILDERQAIFSRDLLRTFIKEFSLFPVFSIVRLNTGDIGQVVEINPNWPLRPSIHVFFQGDGQPVPEERILHLWEDKNLFIARDISDRAFIDHYFQL
jgi:putative nucleotidyltransferase with HDIG domain